MVKVFLNLIDNAVKYSPQDAAIDIRAALIRDKVKVEIKDRGFGIPENDLKRIFDKFYRVERPQQISGIGLGLSICKGIVEAHGGEITARNNQDIGAAFILTLPLN
jgi:two-component system sensor histidine kinase KdpD